MSGGDVPEDVASPAGIRRSRLVVAGLVTVGALVPRLATVGHYFNSDERLWMDRTGAFSDALVHGHPGAMSALEPFQGTVPGITVVWLGSIARLFWTIGTKTGLVDPHQSFTTSASGYTTGQIMVAVATSVLIGLLTWLVGQWVVGRGVGGQGSLDRKAGIRVGAVVGVVLATEPFWVSLGSILHTDELLTLLGMCGLVALCWAFGVPTGVIRPDHPRRWAVAGACLLMASVLTKLDAVVFGPAAVGIIVWALVRDVRVRPDDVGVATAARPMLVTSLWMLVALVVTAVVLYPALLADPGPQFDSISDQIRTVGGTHVIYYQGAVVRRPGLSFYPLSLAYQSTAWLTALLPVGLVVAVVAKASRRYAVPVLSWTVVPFVVLARSGMNYPRYGLVLLGPAILAAACALMNLKSRPARGRSGSWVDRVIALAAVGALVVATVTAPWGGLVYNPVLSAVRNPRQVVRIGWGEPVAAAMPLIAADVAARGLDCSQVTVTGFSTVPIADHGCTPRLGSRKDADYWIVGLPTRQVSAWTLGGLRRDFELVDTAWVYGQPIAQVWRRSGASGS